MKHLNIPISDELHEQVRCYAFNTRQSVAQLVRRALQTEMWPRSGSRDLRLPDHHQDRVNRHTEALIDDTFPDDDAYFPGRNKKELAAKLGAKVLPKELPKVLPRRGTK